MPTSAYRLYLPEDTGDGKMVLKRTEEAASGDVKV
jgi:hypothetical protein